MNVSKTNGVKLLAAVMVLAMVFAGVAVMSDSETDAASTIPTEIGGGLTPEAGKYVSQTYTTGEVIVVSDFIIPNNTVLIVDGAKFTVNEGVTITVQAGGQLVFLSGEIIINGDIVATGTNPENDTLGDKSNTPDENYVAAVINNVEINTTAGSEQKAITLNGNITLERGAKMTATATAVNNDVIVTEATESGDITVTEGSTINVTKRSSGVSIIENQNIYLNQGATFSTNGQINKVTIAATANTTYYTAGAVSINADSNNAYKVDGKENTTTDIRETSNLTFTVTSENTPALIKSGTNSYQQITLRQFIVNVEGTIDAGDKLAFEAGKSFYTGTNADYKANFGDKYYVDNEDNEVDNVNLVVLPMTSVTGTLVVSDYNGTYNKATVNSSVAINGYVSVSGTITVQYDSTDKVSGLVSIEGTPAGYATRGGIIYVTGSVSMNVAAFGTGSGESSTIYQGSIIVDGGNIAIAGADVATLAAKLPYVSAAMYTIEPVTEGIETTYLCDFDVAVAEAAEAKVSEVFVFASGYYALGYNCYTFTDADNAIENGAAVIDADITIPADMEITIAHGLVIAEGATLTLSESVIVNLGYAGATDSAVIYVAGKIVDNDEVMAGYDGADNFVYEVKKTAETETSVIATYTTLKIALGEAQPGEEIQLNGQVTIKENLTIPADVTVITGANGESNKPAITLEGATLTINGTLEMADSANIKLNTVNKVDSKIVVNNVIRNATESTFTDGAIAGAYFVGQIGEDDEGTSYVTSVAVAGTASATVEDKITIIGSVNMGDVTFTQGENNDLKIVISNKGVNKTTPTETEIATAGTITLVGADFELKGAFTGTVQSEVSAGMTAVAFKEGNTASITFVENNDGTTTTTEMVLSSTATSGDTIGGTVTVAQGTVYINGTIVVDMVTVSSGATLEVTGSLTTAQNPDYKAATGISYPKDVQGDAQAEAGLVVAGTANIAGTLIAPNAWISGTLSFTEKATGSNKISGLVDGTVTLADGANVTVGKILLNGTMTGKFAVTTPATADESIIVAYPGSDLTGAIINGDEETDMNATAFYVNGAAVATIYTNSDNMAVTSILGYIDVAGVVYEATGTIEGPKYYSDEAMLNEIKTPTGAYVGEDYPVVYVEMQPSTVTGKISAVQGMTIYIDGLGLKNFENKNGDGYDLTVGDHYITVQVTPGYSATPVVTFNGQTVTDGKITITGEMKEFTLLASGDVSVDTGATGGDGMGLTEILLVILVILIVVMAIMVALRLMRS